MSRSVCFSYILKNNLLGSFMHLLTDLGVVRTVVDVFILAAVIIHWTAHCLLLRLEKDMETFDCDSS